MTVSQPATRSIGASSETRPRSAIRAAISAPTPPQGLETIFDFTYQALPKELADQRQAALDLAGR